MPLTAALSSVLMAVRIASSLGSPAKIVSSALRIRVLTRERYIWLRRCLRSFDRMRFWADLVFAKVGFLSYNIALNNYLEQVIFAVTSACDYSRKHQNPQMASP